MKKIKISLAEIEPVRKAVAVIKEFITEATFRVDKEKLYLYTLDPANVAGVEWTLLSSGCVEWKCEKTKFALNLENFYKILNNAKKNDIVTIQNSDKENYLDIVLKGSFERKYTTPLIEIEDKELNPPQLTPTAKVVIDAKKFFEQIKEAGTVAESVIFTANDKNFILDCKADIDSLNIVNPKDDDIKITVDKKTTSKYSIEYLKKIVKAKSIADEVTLEFGDTYPLTATYSVVDRQKLRFTLAPRVESE